MYFKERCWDLYYLYVMCRNRCTSRSDTETCIICTSCSGAADGVSDARTGVLQGETLRPVLFLCSAQEQLMVCPMPEQVYFKERH